MDEYAQSLQKHQIYLTMCELIFQSVLLVLTLHSHQQNCLLPYTPNIYFGPYSFFQQKCVLFLVVKYIFFKGQLPPFYRNMLNGI